MSRWKLFGRSKSIDEEIECEDPIISETEEEPENSKMIEYRETLCSKDSKLKKNSKFQQAYSNQRIWRDVDSIESNIDGLNKNKAASSTSKLDDDINRAVDRLLSKKKR